VNKLKLLDWKATRRAAAFKTLVGHVVLSVIGIGDCLFE